MGEMLRITSPLTGKSQIPQNKPEAAPSEAFSLQDVNRVTAPHNKGETQAQQNNTTQQEGMPAILTNLLKNPDVTVHFLKGIMMLQELVTLLPVHNKTVSEEMEHLFSQLMLTPEELVQELSAQEMGATAFRGDLFDFLRGLLAQDAGADMKSAIAALLKAVQGERSKQDALNGVGNTFQYLSDAMAPSRKLSQKLQALADAFRAPDAARNFQSLKQEALALSKEVQGSILYGPHAEKLLSILQYDLSRFSTDENSVEKTIKNLVQLLQNKGIDREGKLTSVLEHGNLHAHKGEGRQSKVLETLSEIIEKQAAEKEMSVMGEEKLEKIIHSLLSSPCNFTPLLHYVIPLEQDGMKAFAEMWINQRGEEDEEGGGSGVENTTHMLLAFDVEKMGRFETELFARDKKLEVSIFCPPGYLEDFKGMNSAIAKGIAQTGYRMEKLNLHPLERTRSLMEVFKSLPYKRTGVDVKI